MQTIALQGYHSDKPFRKAFQQCIGSGNLSLAMRAEYVDALAIVQKEIGFRYIRAHGILSDVMAVYHRLPGSDNPYNFTYVDKVFDMFQRQRIRPIVELGFTPSELASGSETVFYWKGNISIPCDYAQWNALVDALVRHLIARYGLEEVRQWPFEVWNEPNFEEFWVNPCLEDYLVMYRQTARTIKAVDAQLPVGGPAADTNGDAYLEQFLRHCKEENLPLDFVTRHAYSSTTPRVTPEFDYQSFHESSFVVDKFRAARELMDTVGFAALPLYITEFNTSYTPRNPIHDMVENAVMLAPILSRGDDYVDMMSYWTFCDVFEELGIPQSFFHGGFGLVGYGLVRKPTHHLFRFFSRLHDHILYRDHNCLVTGDGKDRLALIAWNDSRSQQPLELAITVPAASDLLFVEEQQIGGGYGDPRQAWANMGYPRYPTPQQLEIFQHASLPGVQTHQCERQGERFHLPVTVPPNSVVWARCLPVAASPQDCAQLEEDQILTYI